MSAYMMEDENYLILLDIVRSLYNNPQTRHEFPSFPPCAFSQHDWDVPAKMVALMAQLNHDSVNYRYSHNTDAQNPDEDLQILLGKLESQNNRPTNHRFQTYAKLGDWFDVYGTLRCWVYQSCEISNMTKDQEAVMTWVENFSARVLKYGVRKHLGRDHIWGGLQDAECLKNSASEPPVIDLMDLMR